MKILIFLIHYNVYPMCMKIFLFNRNHRLSPFLYHPYVVYKLKDCPLQTSSILLPLHLIFHKLRAFLLVPVLTYDTKVYRLLRLSGPIAMITNPLIYSSHINCILAATNLEVLGVYRWRICWSWAN